MFKAFRRKDNQEPVPMEKAGGSHDEMYQLPVLHAARFTMSAELSRRSKNEQLRKRYDILPKS